MDSLRTSELRFVDSSGSATEVPGEWETGLLEIVIPDAGWDEALVTIQARTVPTGLRLLDGRRAVVVDWPRSSTGLYNVAVTYRGVRHGETIRILPSKLSDEAFQRVVDDLQGRLPASLAITLQELGAFAGLTFVAPGPSTVAVELRRLERAVMGTDSRAGLALVMQRLAEMPHTVLRVEREWVPAGRARRVTADGLLQTVLRPGNRENDGRLRRVLDTRSMPTVDTHENRVVVAFYEQVRTRLHHLRNVVGRLPSEDPAKIRWSQLVARLEHARRVATFFSEVRVPPAFHVHLTMLLMKRAEYRAALDGYLELNRSLLVAVADQRLDAPLANVPDLYEAWTTLEALQGLLEACAALDFRVVAQRLFRRLSQSLLIDLLPGGRPLVQLMRRDGSREVRITPQRVYGRRGNPHSYSFRQIPDLSVELVTPAGGVDQVLLFDAKYKLLMDDASPLAGDGEPLKGDIDKMHTYRDSIVDTAGCRVVTYAAILYPGISRAFRTTDESTVTASLEAIRSYPGEEIDLRAHVRNVMTDALAKWAKDSPN
jgi:predicted component of viral defense system (DUF524 family)